MFVTNMRQLEQALRQQVKTVIESAGNKALEDMQDELQRYYDSAAPKKYKRTEAMKNTPKLSSVTSDGKEVSVEVYLDQSHRYTTGKNPTMTDVLNLANSGKTDESSVGYLRPTVGERGFIERAEERIEQDCKEIMGKSFEKT